ncbi:MAG: hypothetical protein LBV57_07420 [Candidatus Symbiothrix sp.]|jgi:phosphate uptake regulator|nr:hypothetical protein [Candidatus Symbiothrix sp.]
MMQPVNIDAQIESLLAIVIQQFELVDELIMNGFQESVYQQLQENEEHINRLDTAITQTVLMVMILQMPKASMFRKTLASYEVILFLEQTGNVLMNITDHIQDADLNSSDYAYFKTVLRNMLISIKLFCNTVLIAFLKNDKEQVHQLLDKEVFLEKMLKEVSENIVNAFQEIPLTKQELTNIVAISFIARLIKKIEDNVFDILKLAIFAFEGIDVRHK